jgi:class 3 adenylate cyclase
MEAKTHYADSGGVSIAYQVHGDGPVDLVLVPGFVSQVELLTEDPGVARFFRGLTAFSRMLVFDKRGQGLSDRPGRPPTLEESMDDLKAVIDAAGFERPALLGISEGGPMSTLYAATYPKEVSALILFGTFARMLATSDFPHGIPTETLDRWGALIRRDWGNPVALNIWAPSRVGDREFERWWARLLRQGTSPAGAIALMDLYREMDVRAILPTIDVPTLVLHRVGDRMVPVAQGRYLAETIPGARYVELEGEDHLPFASDLDTVLGEVEEFLIGSRGASESERALATILFTDIVGSTEKAAELGDRDWRQLLERHDAAVRRQLSLHRGREVKTMGDGFLATFDGPARAVRAARAVTEAVRAIGIEVRAGLHTGEVEVVGDDIAGVAVHIGARVASLATAGEVLVSSTVRDLVAGSGIGFADRGAHALKGVPDEWRLYAVTEA